MASRFGPTRVVGVREQAALMRAFPAFRVRVRGATLAAEGELRPTPLSETYRVRIEYAAGRPPDVRVLSPALAPREGADRIPHMYGQERLCLYLPGVGEWAGDMPLGQALIPWISLWLFYYELWHATGEWLGGGVEPLAGRPALNEGREDRHGRSRR